jgi:hypothetical protein
VCVALIAHACVLLRADVSVYKYMYVRLQQQSNHLSTRRDKVLDNCIKCRAVTAASLPTVVQCLFVTFHECVENGETKLRTICGARD